MDMLGTLYIYMHVFNNVRDKRVTLHTARCHREGCDNEIREFIGANSHVNARYLGFEWKCVDHIFPTKDAE